VRFAFNFFKSLSAFVLSEQLQINAIVSCALHNFYCTSAHTSCLIYF